MTSPESCGIEGVVINQLEVHPDERGSFTEIWRSDWMPDVRMVQSNRSISARGVLRGLHFHLRQSDYWVAVEGRLLVGLYDLRVSSATSGLSCHVELDSSEPAGLFIPPGVAHGFLALTEAALIYFVDQTYDGTDEFGIAWDDPEIGLDWGSEEPVLSERDQQNPRLVDIPKEHWPGA